MNKAPILTDEEIRKSYVSAPAPYRSEQDRAVAQKQLDSAHLHYMGVVREIFEAYDRYISLLEEENTSLVGLATTHGWGSKGVEQGKECRQQILELKSRFLEGHD